MQTVKIIPGKIPTISVTGKSARRTTKPLKSGKTSVGLAWVRGLQLMSYNEMRRVYNLPLFRLPTPFELTLQRIAESCESTLSRMRNPRTKHHPTRRR